MRFLYSVIRFEPNPSTGERVNIGVVVGNDVTGEWRIRRVRDLRRAKALDEQGVLPELRQIIDDLGANVEHKNNSLAETFPVIFTEERVRELHASGVGVIRFGEPAVVSASEIDEAVTTISEAVLTEYAPKRRPNIIKKTRAVRAIEESYERHHLERGRDYVQRPRVTGGPIEHEFDFAVMNGSVIQLAHAFSFTRTRADTLGYQIKSWGWTVRGLRDEGGSVDLGAGDKDVSVNVDVVVAYVKPQGSEMQNLFEEAEYIFKDAGVRAFSIREADAIGGWAARNLGKETR